MKKVTLFFKANCPHCKRALAWQQELFSDNGEFSNIPLEMIDEDKQPSVANSYDYFYVPTYYVDGEKVHEGVANKQKIKAVFEKALG